MLLSPNRRVARNCLKDPSTISWNWNEFTAGFYKVEALGFPARDPYPSYRGCTFEQVRCVLR